MNAPAATRRRVLQIAGSTFAGLVLPLPLRLEAATSGGSAALPASAPPGFAPRTAPGSFAPSVFLRIAPDDTVTLVTHRSEMGQGIRTALAMLLCDELDADWSRVRVERADGDARYGDQDTVGDQSLLTCWMPLRTAAAQARAMLVAAAAEALGVPASALRTQDGAVHLAASGNAPARTLRYGELAARASRQPVPDAPPLKKPAEFRLVGKPQPGIDLVAQTTGRMVYGLDVQRPGLQYAVIARAPLPLGTLKRFDAKAALALPGVLAAFALPGAWAAEGATTAGVAIVARDSWACLQGRRALQLEWDLSAAGAMDSDEIRARFDAACDAGGAIYRSGGDVVSARAGSERTLQRRYWTPFLAHATLEPPNCTADVRADACEVWAPSQDPGEARDRIAAELKWPVERVTVHVTDIGGGFGRKSMHDFVLEAVRVSRHQRAPVKLFWTREDDLRHGYFRTPCLQELEAGLGREGGLTFWRHHAVQSSQRPTSGNDGPVTEVSPYELAGSTAMRLPYALPAVEFAGSHVETPLKRSWMRGVQDSYFAFAQNCFLDEVAQEQKRDPVALHLALLGEPRRLQFLRTRASPAYWIDTGRLAAVARRAATLSGWSDPLPAGAGRGFASHVQGATTVAVVAEVHRRADGPGYRLSRLTCVVDCGIVVNPDGARAQVEGALMFGLASALYGEITLTRDGVVQSNFHDYPVARIGDAPGRFDIEFVDSPEAPTGLGEPCAPLLAPALANALARAGAPRPYAWPFGRTMRGEA